MARDKYNAVWVSYSSISDYHKCPRMYFLKNIYRDPNSSRKISLMQPPLALGQTVHAVFEEISVLPLENRFDVPLEERFRKIWAGISGRRGGFIDVDEEKAYQERGLKMMGRVAAKPGPLQQKAIKLRQSLPYYWLSQDDGIILCGKIDWIKYDETNDSVQIIDFKTGKLDEDPDSLQLPIYALLMANIQSRPLTGLMYWYLERDDAPVAMPIPDLTTAKENLLDEAKRIVLARKLERFVCPKKDGCVHCRPYELIVAGRAERVGSDNYNQDVYILNLVSQ